METRNHSIKTGRHRKAKRVGQKLIFKKMTDNQKKGIAFIVGGVLSIFILPFILQLVGLYEISYYLREYFIIYIIALVLVGLGIKQLISSEGSEDILSSQQDNQVQDASGQSQINKVVNVTLAGGIIGMLGSSPQNALNNRIKKENASGWRVIQVIPAESGNIFLAILRIIILCLTIFLYTTANGYYVVLERKN